MRRRLRNARLVVRPNDSSGSPARYLTKRANWCNGERRAPLAGHVALGGREAWKLRFISVNLSSLSR